MKGKILFVCVALLTLCLAIPASAAGNNYNIQKNITQKTISIVGSQQEKSTTNGVQASPFSAQYLFNLNCLVSATFYGHINVFKQGWGAHLWVTVTVLDNSHWTVSTLGQLGRKSMDGYGGQLKLKFYIGTAPSSGDHPASGAPYYCNGFADLATGYTDS